VRTTNIHADYQNTPTLSLAVVTRSTSSLQQSTTHSVSTSAKTL
jgi:hypothetical protein